MKFHEHKLVHDNIFGTSSIRKVLKKPYNIILEILTFSMIIAFFYLLIILSANGIL